MNAPIPKLVFLKPPANMSEENARRVIERHFNEWSQSVGVAEKIRAFTRDYVLHSLLHGEAPRDLRIGGGQ